MSGLAQTGVAAFKWSALSTVGRFALQLLAQVLLARMLGPDNYGVFGIGMLVLTLCTFLTNFGFGWNLLYKPDLTDEDIRFAFTWQVVAGLVALVALQFGAGWLAEYFRDPRVEPVIRWLSLACLISSATSPAMSLMQRALNFRTLGLVQIGSYFLGYVCVGLTLAFLGAGVNALVAAWLVQTLAVFLGTFFWQRHPVRPLFHYSGTRDAMRRGTTVFGINVVNWGLNNIDRLVLGRLLNAQAVGHYSVGYNLAIMPNTLLLSALQPAFTAAGAQMGGDKQRLGNAYLQILSTVLVLITPCFALLSVSSPHLVAFLYGTQWAETGPVLGVLFLGMPAYVVWGVSTPVLTNAGRLHHEFWLQIPVLVLAAAAFFALTSSPLVAAWLAVAVLLARMVVVCVSAFQVLDLSLLDIAADMVRGLLLSMLCAGAAHGVHRALEWVAYPLIPLVVGGALGGLVLLSMVLVKPTWLGHRAIGMLGRFMPKLAVHADSHRDGV